MCRRWMGEGGPAGREAPPLSALAQLQRRFTGDGSSEGASPAPGVSTETCLKILCLSMGATFMIINGTWFMDAHKSSSGFACQSESCGPSEHSVTATLSYAHETLCRA